MTSVRVVVGGGGVGKTTLVTARSLRSAYQGQKTLALTFDPSLRLKDLLNQELTFQNKNLDVFFIDPSQIFEDLLSQVSAEDAQIFKSNKLFKYLLEGIVGLQEFTSLYYLMRMIQSRKYDVIYVDTPPFQNALEFFQAPEKLKRLFESRVLGLFIDSEREGLFKSLIKSSSRIALKTLQSLTGLDFFKQLLDFIRVLEKVKPHVLDTLDDVDHALHDGRILVDYISAYGPEPIQQADAFIDELKNMNLEVSHYYLSKYPGEWDIFLENAEKDTTSPLQRFLRKKALEGKKTEELLRDLSEKHKIDIIRVPYFTENIGLTDMAEKWDEHTKQTSI